jgi:flagellar basal-body rod protein FlgC
LEEVYGDVQHGSWQVELASGQRSKPGAQRIRDGNGCSNNAPARDRRKYRKPGYDGIVAGRRSLPAEDNHIRKRSRSGGGVETVKVKTIGLDGSDLPLRYDPANPAANPQGYVKLPNVNSFIEVMDMREAEHSYSANLSVMQATRSMLNKTIDLLK